MDHGVLVVAAAIFSEGRFLIARRGPEQVGAGLWEFPGGKVDSGETEEQALHREIFEELRIEITALRFLAENVHQYPGKKIHLKLYYAEPESMQIQLIDHDLIRWAFPQELSENEFSEADRPFVQLIQQRKW